MTDEPSSTFDEGFLQFSDTPTRARAREAAWRPSYHPRMNTLNAP